MDNKKQHGFLFSALMISFISFLMLYNSACAQEVSAFNPVDTSALTEPVDQGGLDGQTAIDTQVSVTERDPLEGYNRAMFKFNDTVDIVILKPVAKFYNLIMPRPLNEGVHNFFNNLWNFTTVCNDILQLNLYQATSDLWRLGINTTVGIGGLFDVASRMNLPLFVNDFGLTLGRWGWTNSTYIVWPFFGPSTIRDGIEIPVDNFWYLSAYRYIEPPSLAWQLWGVGVVDRRAQLLKFQNVMEEAAYDKYIFVRNAYLQRRAFQVNQVQHLGPAERNIEPMATGRRLNS